jgi:hypothetical protein
MLILVQRVEICTISLDSPDYTNFVLPLTGIKHAIAVDYDPVDGYLYWTDDEASSISLHRQVQFFNSHLLGLFYLQHFTKAKNSARSLLHLAYTEMIDFL